MTNYAAWEAFDVDQAINEGDKLQVPDFALKVDPLVKETTESLELIANSIRKTADALRSKAAVAALKESRIGNRRNKQQDSVNLSNKDGSSLIPISVPIVVVDSAVGFTFELSKIMETISKDLASLLEKLDLLRKSIRDSNSQSSIRAGLHTGLSLLRDITRLELGLGLGLGLLLGN
jgi:hypothetical protein